MGKTNTISIIPNILVHGNRGASVTSCAFTLLEIMITLSILTIGLFAVLDTTTSIRFEGEGLRQQEQATVLARSIAESIQTAKWEELGNVNKYFQRRATPVSGAVTIGNAPLNAKELVSLGYLTTPPRLPDVEVYVEYYRLSLLDRMNELIVGGTSPRMAWSSLVGDEILQTPPTDVDAKCWMIDPIDHGQAFNIEDQLALDHMPCQTSSTVRQKLDDGVFVRILVSWTTAGVDASKSSQPPRRLWTETFVGIRKPT